MKLTGTREELLAPLQSVIGVVERRQTMPVLANVLLSARENRLSITGTDLEVELVAMTAGGSHRNQLHLQISARDAQAILACRQQHVREYGHRLPALHHTDDTLERSEKFFACSGELHRVFFLRDLKMAAVVTEAANNGDERSYHVRSTHCVRLHDLQCLVSAGGYLCIACV